MTQHVGIATIVGRAALALLASATPAIAQTGAEPALALLPMPQSVVRGTGSFTVANGATIAATDAGASAAARLLADHVRTTRGLALTPGTTGAIRLVRDGLPQPVLARLLLLLFSSYSCIIFGDAIQELPAAPSDIITTIS